MDTFLLRLRFRLLLLLLLLPPVAPDDCPECVGAEGETKECKCKIGSELKMKTNPETTAANWTDPTEAAISVTAGRYTLPADKKSLTLKPVKAEDGDKVYMATYSGSKTQKFKVIPLVVCETDNGPCNVPQGQNVRLKAGNAAYSWFLGSVKKKTVDGNLDILSVAKTDSGKYEAIDTADGAGAAKKTIQLSVNMPAGVKPAAADSNLRAKSGRQLEVKARSSGPAKVGAEWSLDCVVTQNGTRVTHVTHFAWLKDGLVMSGQTGAEFVFPALKAMDAAAYRCKAGDDESPKYVLTVVGSGAVAPSSSLMLLLTLSLLLGLLCC